MMLLGMPVWVWVVVALIFVVPLFSQCGQLGVPGG